MDKQIELPDELSQAQSFFKNYEYQSDIPVEHRLAVWKYLTYCESTPEYKVAREILDCCETIRGLTLAYHCNIVSMTDTCDNENYLKAIRVLAVPELADNKSHDREDTHTVLKKVLTSEHCLKHDKVILAAILGLIEACKANPNTHGNKDVDVSHLLIEHKPYLAGVLIFAGYTCYAGHLSFKKIKALFPEMSQTERRETLKLLCAVTQERNYYGANTNIPLFDEMVANFDTSEGNNFAVSVLSDPALRIEAKQLLFNLAAYGSLPSEPVKKILDDPQESPEIRAQAAQAYFNNLLVPMSLLNFVDQAEALRWREAHGNQNFKVYQDSDNRKTDGKRTYIAYAPRGSSSSSNGGNRLYRGILEVCKFIVEEKCPTVLAAVLDELTSIANRYHERNEEPYYADIIAALYIALQHDNSSVRLKASETVERLIHKDIEPMFITINQHISERIDKEANPQVLVQLLKIQKRLIP